jgi:1-acyl-sn-glycerol-3-phosphate acyltransferase
MIDIEKALTLKYPNLKEYPSFLYKSFIYFLKKIIHEKEINEFLEKNKRTIGIDFVELITEYFNFKYTISDKDKENIPAQGRVIIIANHPLGALDALALIKLVGEVRSDIKVIANDILYNVDQLKSMILPVDNMNRKSTKHHIQAVYDALNNEEAVIVFPAGEVSRAKVTGIKDQKWQKGFLRFAHKTSSPILPVFIGAKNSFNFYAMSSMNKKLSTLFLVNEMFKQQDKTINFKIGEIIPFDSLNLKNLKLETATKLLKKHLYKVSKGKKGVFSTMKSIAHPESRQDIKKELKEMRLLGETVDHKKIYLYEYSEGSIILKELGRLREITFRKVGEGSGKRRDHDEYDIYYQHIILWDDEDLEIVGSYRIANSNKVMELLGIEGFYTSTIFDFKEKFMPYFEDSIELGRSFVQPKYWGSRALDYLWYGIGAYLKEHENIKYMFGAVSLSSLYSKEAQNMILYFYERHFGGYSELAESRNRYLLSNKEKKEFDEVFTGSNYRENFRTLKTNLQHYNATVPTLFKQYTELCEDGGVKFLDFGIDPDFGDCMDGLILVDVDKIKPSKRDRYINSHRLSGLTLVEKNEKAPANIPDNNTQEKQQI